MKNIIEEVIREIESAPQPKEVSAIIYFDESVDEKALRQSKTMKQDIVDLIHSGKAVIIGSAM